MNVKREITEEIWRKRENKMENGAQNCR